MALNMRNWQGACECHPKLGTTNRDVRRGLENLTAVGMGPHRLLMHAENVLTTSVVGSHFATQLMQL